RLIDVGVVRDGRLEVARVTQPALTHHPRNEGGRPRESPARDAGNGLAPVLVLAFENPGTPGRDRPVAADRRGCPCGFGGAHTTRPAPARPARTPSSASFAPAPAPRHVVIVGVVLDD